MSVVVVGSLNMDLVVRLPDHPRAGETVRGESFVTCPGGKGANQAVGAARLGAATTMIGRVGDDAFGAALRETLAREGVDVAGLDVAAGVASGCAVISIDAAAQNRIIVVPGANGRLSPDDVRRHRALLRAAKVLLLQLETPVDAGAAAAEAARAAGATVVLDPAPAAEVGDDLLRLVDVLTPNQTEAEALTGVRVDGPDDAVRAGAALLGRGVRNVIVKLGGRGSVLCDCGGARWFPPAPIEPIDTVAAGDAFNAGLAAALASGLPLPEAMRWANAAGAACATRRGALEAMPTRADLDPLLARQGEPQRIG